MDDKLSFDAHAQNKISKCNKIIVIVKQLSAILPRDSLLTPYKMLIRPHPDYANIIYDRPNNELFCKNIESVQYKACLATTGTIQGTS